MKKQWTNVAIEEVKIQETAGGPVYNTTQDAEAWWNAEENRWEVPVGEPDTGKRS